MIPVELTPRSKEVYFEIIQLFEDVDFKAAVLRSIYDDLQECEMLGVEPEPLVGNWTKHNFYLAYDEKIQIANWVNKYGILPIQNALMKLYDEHCAIELLNSVGLMKME